jgi:hypothetical protein
MLKTIYQKADETTVQKTFASVQQSLASMNTHPNPGPNTRADHSDNHEGAETPPRPEEVRSPSISCEHTLFAPTGSKQSPRAMTTVRQWQTSPSPPTSPALIDMGNRPQRCGPAGIDSSALRLPFQTGRVRQVPHPFRCRPIHSRRSRTFPFRPRPTFGGQVTFTHGHRTR